MTSNNLSQSAYSSSDSETPQGTAQNRLQNFDQSFNHVDLGHSIEQSMKNAQKEVHQKRIQTLRKELDYLKATDWEFEFEKDEIRNLEASASSEQWSLQDTEDQIPNNAKCFQRSGVITCIYEHSHVLIDDKLRYDMTSSSVNVNLNDKVIYLAYCDENDQVIVVRILENQGLSWGDDEEETVDEFDVLKHNIVGEVDFRKGRIVYIKDSDLKFNLDEVQSTIVPIKGDWLEIDCTIQWDEKKPCDIEAKQVLQVLSVRPLRTKVKEGVITVWDGVEGIIDRGIYFDAHCLESDIVLEIGAKVKVEAIESNQGVCSWRAINIKIKKNALNVEISSNVIDDELNSLVIEKERSIEVTHPLRFDKIDLNNTGQIKLTVKNNSDHIHVINKWIILSKKKDSQVTIEPFLSRPMKLQPKASFHFNITCQPKFLGNTNECLIIMMKGFQIKRFINITIVNKLIMADNENDTKGLYKTQYEKIELLRKSRMNNGRSVLPGVKTRKPPAFISVKLGIFPIPDKVWSAVLGDSQATFYSSDFQSILRRIEYDLPCLLQELNINNYTDKWHTLLYMEEIQANINMKRFDMAKVFLTKYQDCLGIEIKDLAEQRPSLILGDKAIVKDNWSNDFQWYEGVIHDIKGDMVLMKFNPRFHEKYTGSDVAVEFTVNRAIFRRCHQAINLCISNLGPNILFPHRIIPNSDQVSKELIENINWFNPLLNTGQKTAVSNILLGKCRPLPYCIFGPPGTGKTITVIETILQILRMMPDSRILVATPSNSAANLITERLVFHRQHFPDSIIRLIAYYLVDSDNIPEIIKPYCATMDIAVERSAKPTQMIRNNVQINCSKSFIGRHRVTIGTCQCLGNLAQLGFPKGHFTHVIVDEAGQATEPDIMIPLTFVDKEIGQIILAGDPLQLGPVILSKYAAAFGMEESFLSRILKTFPYQNDTAAFKLGYDHRVITKLTDNYRSLEEVLSLPSKMFYNDSLKANLDRSQSWVLNILEVVNNLFEISNANKGGIFVYGIKGINTRAEDSPSWYNPQEASMVALTTCKFYKKNISADDIGIITPYVAQIKYLRLVFDAMGLAHPKIGTVEDFQGQERPVILLSTVRSTESYLQNDERHSLGFVKNPKRLNVALTRAQVAVLLFCDPHLLCTDPLWNKVISHAVKEDTYMGTSLPPHLCNGNE